MSKNTKIILGIIIAAVIIGGICWAARREAAAPVVEEVNIGFIGPLSGNAVNIGESIKKAIVLAVDEINSQGGIKGKRIKMIYEDGKCSNKDAVNAAQKLINIDKVKVIIGGICSGETLAVAPIAEQNKVVLITPASASTDVTQAGDYVFRNTVSDAVGTEILANYIIKNNKSASIISEQADYSQGWRQLFIENFSKLGGEILNDESYLQDTRDFRSILTKIKSGTPNVLIINPQTDITGGNIIRQAREMGVNAPLYGNNVCSGAKSIENAGSSIEGMILLSLPNLDMQNPKAKNLIDKYKQSYGEITWSELHLGSAYDNVYILSEAISNVGYNAEEIKNYLYNMNYSGTIGTYNFDKNGDAVGIEFAIKTVKDKKLVDVD